MEHLRYVERDGVGPKGEPGQGYSARVDEADIEAFEARSRGDRHQFRFIVSPENAGQLEDLRGYTRQLMDRVESDLATRLDWVAVDHWDTDNPHTHVVLRGKDEAGRDLVISGEYIAHGLRKRACEIATAWLGSRTEFEIRQSLTREVEQERWISLDRALQRGIENGSIDLKRFFTDTGQSQTRLLLLGRLRALERMRLAEEQATGQWTLHPDSERILRTLGERGDIIRTMQRAMGADARAIVILDPRQRPQPVVGRVLATGMTEHDDRSYLVLDGIDGKAYFVPMKPGIACEARLGAIVEVRGATSVREIDKSIAAMAKDGIYRTCEHFARPVTGSRGHLRADLIKVHVRRLEALRRAGIVERLEDGVWRVPADLPAQGAKYDVRKRGRLVVEVHSHLPLEQNVRALGATWLDRQLVQGAAEIGDLGFGAEVRASLRQRIDFLVGQGLAERHVGRVLLRRNLLSILTKREIEQMGKTIASETGLAFRSTADGQRIGGQYQRNVQLASGRYAMLVGEKGFSLVPWKAVIEKHRGKTITATVRGNDASWEIRAQRGLSLS